MRAKSLGVLLLALLIPGRSVLASDVREIDAALANRIVQGCVDQSTPKRQSHAIAVVDPGGALIAFLRMDGNTSGIGDFAIQKAAAVAAWHFSTESMAKSAASTPGFAAAPHVVTVGGGIPVYTPDGKTFIGAVGVSGEAPEDDIACAKAGVAAAGLAFERR